MLAIYVGMSSTPSNALLSHPSLFAYLLIYLLNIRQSKG